MADGYLFRMDFNTIRDRNGLPILFVQQSGGTSDLIFDRQGRNVGSLSARGTVDVRGEQLSPDRAPGLLAGRSPR